jgi:predicted small secreted protein
MKKIRLYFVILLVSTAFVLGACKKDKKAKSCSELAADASTAAAAFATSFTQSACNDYLQALKDYRDGCRALSSAERDNLDASISEINCSDY